MNARTFILTACAAFAIAVPAANAQLDAVTILRVGPHPGTYQLEVQNTSNLGYIKTFDWVPEGEFTITAITSTKGGACRLANDMMTCTGSKQGIPPPNCTCRAGGSMTVAFTATGNLPTFNGRYWTHYGTGSHTYITQMTVVPYHIPSFESPPAGYYDLPLCPPGIESTDLRPCALA